MAFDSTASNAHNHPFQPWKKAAFEGLSAFYGQVDFGFSGLHEKPTMQYEIDDKKAGAKRIVQPSVPDRPDLVPNTGNRRQQLAAWVTHKDNPYFAHATVNRFWGLLFGLPLIEPVDDIGTVLLEPQDDLKPTDPRRLQRVVLDRLAKDFVDHNFDLQRLIRVIVAARRSVMPTRQRLAGRVDRGSRSLLGGLPDDSPAAPIR